MRRREFIASAGAATGSSFIWPAVARAQQPERMRRIAILAAGANDSDGQARIAAFRQGLQALGWREGGNVVIDIRWGDYVDGGIAAAAAEIVNQKPDVILTNGDRGLRVLRQATRIIPIVFAGAYEPVDGGFVASLARPGGNITGLANVEPSLAGKLMGLLKQAAPHLSRVAFWQPSSIVISAERTRARESAETALGMKTMVIPFSNAADVERGMAEFAREPDGGMVLAGESTAYRALFLELLARYRLPAIFNVRSTASTGWLLFYGADVNELARRAATYVDRILKGEKPGDLPVQMPTRFELAINLKTAKELGLTVPSTLLAIADEVIE